MNEEKLAELQKLVAMVMEWLGQNAHPHVKIIVDSERSEVMEGLAVIQRNRHPDCPVKESVSETDEA
jgi:hypothetical protein